MTEEDLFMSKTLAAGILFTLPFWACAKRCHRIYTNDLHAHVEPYKCRGYDGKRDIGDLGQYHHVGEAERKSQENKATWRCRKLLTGRPYRLQPDEG